KTRIGLYFRSWVRLGLKINHTVSPSQMLSKNRYYPNWCIIAELILMTVMAKLLFVLTLLMFSSQIVAQDKKVGEFQFTAKDRNHSVKLVVRTKVFVRAS